jgi:hypothetical protein
MIKYSIVLFHLVGLFGFQLFFDDGVVIEDDTPTDMIAGETETVTVRVNKGDIEGFAKLELMLPVGLTASPAETHGASFTFSGQKAKFIWMALPDDQEFSVSYNLMATESAAGNLVVKGTFSYIKENQRVDYEMQSKLIAIVTEASVVENTDDQPSDIDVSIDGSLSNDSDNTGLSTDDADLEGLACVRTVNRISDNEYLVSLKVVNAQLEGFAKIMEYVSPGDQITEEDSDGAITTVDNGGVKYVWFEAPELADFKVVYRLRTMSSVGPPQLNGTLSYVSGNTPQEIAVIDSGEVIDNDTDIVETATDSTADGSVSDTVQDTNLNDTSTEISVEAGSDNKEASSIPDPEIGITYKVQILAGHNPVGRQYFKKRHQFSEGINIENHEGWVKYTTGSHDVYKTARDERERINGRYELPGPFVTAYNEGVRIVVQEALMISNQKWYQ